MSTHYVAVAPCRSGTMSHTHYVAWHKHYVAWHKHYVAWHTHWFHKPQIMIPQDSSCYSTKTLGSEGIIYRYQNVMIHSYRFNTPMNTIYGYWRCSTDAQDQERQIRALKDAGSEVIVGDKITGTSNYGDREALSKLLDLSLIHI